MPVQDFTSIMGPGDDTISSNHRELGGYQPVSRVGEIVMNAFVDPYEYNEIVSKLEEKGKRQDDVAIDISTSESVPRFHEWASVREGMITVSKLNKHSRFQKYTAAETAIPVISAAIGLRKEDEQHYFFSGVSRSKSVVEASSHEGGGGSVTDFFTVALGGAVTILNTSGGYISPGDCVCYSFEAPQTGKRKRAGGGPRRIGIRKVANIGAMVSATASNSYY